ncbi:MAG TPA: hypothetical protein VF997_13610, partial [Polyangia bacterium]
GMPGVDTVVDQGNVQEVRVSGDPQAFLRALVARTRVQQFEITRPSRSCRCRCRAARSTASSDRTAAARRRRCA